jgi:hypothetical protein
MSITVSTLKRITDKKQPKFQFHVNKELQQQLPLSTHKLYSSMVTKQSTQKKKLIIVQPSPQQKVQPIKRHQQTSLSTQATLQSTQMSATPLQSGTVATDNSGLSIDQQTIANLQT